MAITIDKNILKQATGANDSNATLYLPYINSAMKKYSINTKPRVLTFLSQIGHESGGLKYSEEIASGSAYEGRKDLGNIYAGDGVRFKGRSPLQITGRSNYTELSKDAGVDFVSNPSLLAQPKYGAMASAWWWNKHGLNELADKMDLTKSLSDPTNDEVFKQITKRINGGYNGLAQRQSNWVSGQNAVLNFASNNPKTTAFGIFAFALAVSTAIYYFVNRKSIESGSLAIAI